MVSSLPPCEEQPDFLSLSEFALPSFPVIVFSREHIQNGSHATNHETFPASLVVVVSISASLVLIGGAELVRH